MKLVEFVTTATVQRTYRGEVPDHVSEADVWALFPEHTEMGDVFEKIECVDANDQQEELRRGSFQEL